MEPIFNIYKTLLHKIISFKSISTDHTYSQDIMATAEWYIQLFKEHGFDVQLLQGPHTFPVVLARYIVDTALPTVLVYGHYDVQPANQEGWETDPFEVIEKEDRFYGRGVVDNKGQSLVHIATVLHLIATKNLAKNITFIIEGNEETSNPDLKDLLIEHKSLCACDAIMVSDGEISGNHPVIETTLRGCANIKVTYKTAFVDAHSGIYGGAIPNAAHELATLASKFYDVNTHTVAVDGFYEKVPPLNKIEKLNNIEVEEYLVNRGKTQMNHVGTRGYVGELISGQTQLPFHEQTTMRPTLQVSGFISGYTEEGFASIVPHKAEMKINIRTVAPQSTSEIVKKVEDFIRKNTPVYVDVDIESTESYDPAEFMINGPINKEAYGYVENAFEKTPIITRVGGSIPIVADLQSILKAEVLLIPFGNDDCNMHGANENARIDIIKKGIVFSSLFFSSGKLPQQ
jgi:acetylornithine deacetylase/succinyl-diaminopimelate desuccinylase-like protein